MYQLSSRVCQCDNPELQTHTQPCDGAVDVKRVDHVPVHQTRRVHKCHQAKLLLLRGGDLGGQIVRDTWNIQNDMCVQVSPSK